MLVQVSVGTLLAFTTVAISVLILRYVPPEEVPLISSLQESLDSVRLQFHHDTQEIGTETSENLVGSNEDDPQPLLDKEETILGYSLIKKELSQGNCKEQEGRIGGNNSLRFFIDPL